MRNRVLLFLSRPQRRCGPRTGPFRDPDLSRYASRGPSRLLRVSPDEHSAYRCDRMAGRVPPRFVPGSADVAVTRIPSQLDIPFFQRHRDNGQTLNNGAVTLATIFRAHGYRTAAFVASFVLDRRFGLSQGFTEYDGSFDLDQSDTTDPGNVKRPGGEVCRPRPPGWGRTCKSLFFCFCTFTTCTRLITFQAVPDA